MTLRPYAQARPTPVTPPATMPKGDGGQPAAGTPSVADLIRAEIRACREHPMPLPKPSCWTCARNGAFERAARISADANRSSTAVVSGGSDANPETAVDGNDPLAPPAGQHITQPAVPRNAPSGGAS